MFKIYKRTVHIRTSKTPIHSLEYNTRKQPRLGLAKLLTVPAMLAGAVVGALAFSVFFIVLLIPIGIMGFRTWRMLRTARQPGAQQTEHDTITAEYTVISETDKK